MQNLVLFGGGLHANVCIDIFEKDGKFNIVGIVDSIASVGTILFGYPVIGRQYEIADLIQKYKIDVGFIAIGDNYDRKFVRDVVISHVPDFNFVNAIHPQVSIGRNVKLGIGIAMAPNVVVNADAVVEDFCILNTGAQLEHNSYMGEFAHLSVGVVTGGKVKIGKFATITAGTTIIDRISIGMNTVVGSGSVVLKDLPDNVVAYGNPAAVVRIRTQGEKIFKSKNE